MPELPEVETTKTSLAPLLGQLVTNVNVYQPKLRWQVPSDLSSLIGHRLLDVQRRAKYLILQLQQDPHPHASSAPDKYASSPINADKKLIVHLGMSGSLQQHPLGFAPRKHDQVVVQFTDTSTGEVTQLHYHDPRRFGAILWHEDYADKLLNHLGIEPLSDDFDGSYLYDLIHRTALQDTPAPNTTKPKVRLKPIVRPIKAVIMEQSVVVGVGNIYASESLFLAGIHPSTPAHQLTLHQLEQLAGHIKQTLTKAISLGGSTLRDFTVATGTTGYFQQTLLVYGRDGHSCTHCGTTLEKQIITGRSSVFCPVCQPL